MKQDTRVPSGGTVKAVVHDENVSAGARKEERRVEAEDPDGKSVLAEKREEDPRPTVYDLLGTDPFAAAAGSTREEYSAMLANCNTSCEEKFKERQDQRGCKKKCLNALDALRAEPPPSGMYEPSWSQGPGSLTASQQHQEEKIQAHKALVGSLGMELQRHYRQREPVHLQGGGKSKSKKYRKHKTRKHNKSKKKKSKTRRKMKQSNKRRRRRTASKGRK